MYVFSNFINGISSLIFFSDWSVRESCPVTNEFVHAPNS